MFYQVTLMIMGISFTLTIYFQTFKVFYNGFYHQDLSGDLEIQVTNSKTQVIWCVSKQTVRDTDGLWLCNSNLLDWVPAVELSTAHTCCLPEALKSIWFCMVQSPCWNPRTTGWRPTQAEVWAGILFNLFCSHDEQPGSSLAVLNGSKKVDSPAAGRARTAMEREPLKSYSCGKRHA